MAKRPERITSPLGEAVWPKLNKPDRMFNKDGVYEVKLRLSEGEASPFIAKLKGILKTHVDSLGGKKRMAPLPWKEVEDDDGNPTGEMDFKFKLKAIGGSGDNQFSQRPALYDSAGKIMTENIGGGSKIQIGAEVVTYDVASIGVGISLRLKAVKVFELKSYEQGSDSWEFSDGGGFVTEGSEPATETEGTEPATETEAVTPDGFDF